MSLQFKQLGPARPCHLLEDDLDVMVMQINHAGEGGLYAELVRDRSFDALALSNQFTDTSPNMTEAEFKYMTEQANASALPNAAVEYNTNTGHASKASKMKFKQ